MMWPLALEAWSLTGKPLPDYARDKAPVRRFRKVIVSPPTTDVSDPTPSDTSTH